MESGAGTLRFVLACAALLASLSLVMWRQSRALETLRALDEVRAERSLAEAQRSALVREIQQLESRSRVVAVAADRLGMRVPSAGEIVILVGGTE
jgi:cell division protein FtsL